MSVDNRQREAAPDVRRIPIHSDLDIVAARIEGRNLAREIGFGIIDQARVATAISELARNVLVYAQGGQVNIHGVAVCMCVYNQFPNKCYAKLAKECPMVIT